MVCVLKSHLLFSDSVLAVHLLGCARSSLLSLSYWHNDLSLVLFEMDIFTFCQNSSCLASWQEGRGRGLVTYGLEGYSPST